MNGITAWSIRHSVSLQALAELRLLLCQPMMPPLPTASSEAAVQNNVRLAASRQGWLLFRNNSGVLPDANGRPIRFGLANDSPQVNKICKSSDLIGLRPIQITRVDVGKTLGQFVAIECKSGNWKKPSGERETAQQNFINAVSALGGYGKFTTGEL